MWFVKTSMWSVSGLKGNYINIMYVRTTACSSLSETPQ